jgi:hypothetical protein
MEKGIVIIATGHPYYGRMAFNLALTIKAAENIPIAIIYRQPGINHLNEHQRSIFDHTILLGDNYGTGFTTKLYLDELSPFDKTLFLDADMLWLPSMKPSELFDSLNGIQYTGITEGKTGDANRGYYFWGDHDEILKVYEVQTIYQWRSEIIYFEKGTQVFSTSRTLHPEIHLKSVKRFGDLIPDELYLNIATAICNVHPHQYKWTPAYWPRMHGDFIKPQLNGYYLVSFGSNYASPQMKNLYDKILRNATTTTGMQSNFVLHSKRSFMEERKKM